MKKAWTWPDQHGVGDLLNRSGTTFRKLPEADRQGRGINRRVYDVTSKPPGAIEWE